MKLELADPQAKETHVPLPVTGPHGIPIEGQWYTSIFRNTLIGQVDDKDYIERDFQDLREISLKGGGDEVVRGDKPIRYAVREQPVLRLGHRRRRRATRRTRTFSARPGRS